MAKSLKTLANQLRKNSGLDLITTFDDSIVPGSVVVRKKWNDIDHVGKLTDDSGITAAALGEVQGPSPAKLVDFERSHDLSVGAALDVLQPVATVKPSFKRAKAVSATFSSPVIYGLSLITIEEVVEKAAPWDRPLGGFLLDKKTFVVYQIVRAKLVYTFTGSGGAGIDLQATGLKNLKSAGLNANWTWRNKATLETKKEQIVAVNIARYAKRKKRFLPR